MLYILLIYILVPVCYNKTIKKDIPISTQPVVSPRTNTKAL